MFAEAMHLSADQVLGTILILSATHVIPEAIFAGVIVTPIALALRKALRKDVPKVKKEEPNEAAELPN